MARAGFFWTQFFRQLNLSLEQWAIVTIIAMIATFVLVGIAAYAFFKHDSNRWGFLVAAGVAGISWFAAADHVANSLYFISVN